MTSFFKKINPNNKNSLKMSSTFDSPPTSSLPLLPTPPLNNHHLKEEFNILKRLSNKEKLNNNDHDVTNVNDLIDDKNDKNKGNISPDQTKIISENIHENRINSNSNKRVKSSNSDMSNIFPTPWKKKKLYNSPFPRFGHAVSSLTSTSGALYLMGGLSGNNVYGDMWVIEPIRKNDSNLSNNQNYSYISSPIENFQKIPSPRTGHASILIGNAFIIFAGDTAINIDQSLDNKLYFFNISSLKWTITSPEGLKPCGRYGHQISVLNFELNPNKWSSQLFVFGGQLNDEYFNDLWKFDLSNFRNPQNKWIKIISNGDIPPPLTNHTMTAIGDKLYIFGGHNDLIINDKLYCYDAIDNEWSICKLNGSILPPALYGHSAATFGSLIFIYGGKLSNDLNSGDMYIIDLSSFNCWKLQSNLPYSPGPRYGHSITVDPIEEKILIMGGDIYDTDFNGIEDSYISTIDEAKFSLLSSVIYECDIKKLEKFIDKESFINSNDIMNSNSKTIFPAAFGQDLIEKSKSNIDLQDSPGFAGPIVSSTPIPSSDDDDEEEEEEEEEEDLDITIPLEEKSLVEDDIKESHTENIPDTLNADDNNNDVKNNLVITDKTIDDKVSYNSIHQENNSLTSKLNSNSNIKDLKDSNTSSSFTTPLLQQQPVLPFINSTNTTLFSPAILERDNMKLQRLMQMVNEVKTEMKNSVSHANSQIVKLENEKKELIEKLNNSSNDPTMLEKNLKLEDFIKQELSIMPDLNRLLQNQTENIKTLSSKIQGEELLKHRIYELEAQNSTLNNKIENLSALYNIPTDIDNVDNKDPYEDYESLTTKIDLLLQKWTDKKGIDVESAGNLKNANKELAKKLEDNTQKLKEFENLYIYSKSSLDKTHKALLISQSDTNKLKDQINILTNELEDMKLGRRIYSNSSSKIHTSSTNRNFSANSSTTTDNNSSKGEEENEIHQIENEDLENIDKVNVNETSDQEYDDELDLHDISLIDATYAVKIKDLEANLFIVSQERDQLREELVNLKKQMYNRGNN